MDGGIYLNLAVRELKVAPIYARVGDVIRIEMVVEDVGDLVPGTTDAEIHANGTIVARKPIAYGHGGEGGRIRREIFLWDTRGYPPGEYRMKGEVFVWQDASPFDNSLDVGQPLFLLPEGAALPPGAKEGGVALARDPRYKPAARPPREGDRSTEGTAGD
jgi:hypothetical protein